MSSPTMDRNQRLIMLVMPLFFVLFVINFPAGVLVYWITTNTWTMSQQYIIKRRIGPVKAAVAADGAPPGAAAGRARPGQTGDGLRDQRQRQDQRRSQRHGVDRGGLGGLIRGRGRQAAEPVDTRPAAPPPKSPRKKKKRSGRRR